MDDGSRTHDFVARIAPVGRRLLGRQARLLRATGATLGEAVARRHETPDSARAAQRLAPVKLVSRSAAPAAAAPAAAAPPAPDAGGSGFDASGESSTVLPGISDWAAE